MLNGDTTRLRELQGLLSYPREDLNIELKDWIDLHLEENRANLAHAILAIANHGGGYIVIGFAGTEAETYAPGAGRPLVLGDYSYTQDEINGIVLRYTQTPHFTALWK